MIQNLDKIREKLVVAERFYNRYAHEFNEVVCSKFYCELNATNATLQIGEGGVILAGEVFGRSGWTRTANYCEKFNWTKIVRGVKIIINNAEDNKFEGSPVAEKAFPIQLNDQITP